MSDKKITIQDLQNASSPEELRALLDSAGGEISMVIPDTQSLIQETVPEDLDLEETILVPPSQIQEPKIKSSSRMFRKTDTSTDKFRMTGGKVAVSLSTNGRFSIPETVYFPDYSVQDINDIALSRTEDILENIVVILDRNKKDDSYSVYDMLLEEFYELLVGMKLQFNPGPLNHRWICKCQEDVPDSQKKPSEQLIDLEEIVYVSIESCDEQIRDHFRNIFNNISEEQFKLYLSRKYGDGVIYSRDEEIERIHINEPVVMRDEEHVYEFEFPRVKHLLKALKMGGKKFNWKIRNKKNEQIRKSEEMESRRKEEVELLELEKSKFIILAVRALSLISFDGKPVTSDDDRISIFSRMSRSTMMRMSTISDRVKIGIQEERDFTCNLCGDVERRSLQREINPVELLPLDDSSRNDSTRKPQINTTVDIYFGF